MIISSPTRNKPQNEQEDDQFQSKSKHSELKEIESKKTEILLCHQS